MSAPSLGLSAALHGAPMFDPRNRGVVCYIPSNRNLYNHYAYYVPRDGGSRPVAEYVRLENQHNRPRSVTKGITRCPYAAC